MANEDTTNTLGNDPKNNALASAAALKKTAADLRKAANILLVAGIILGVAVAAMENEASKSATPGMLSICGAIAVTAALRFFARLAAIQAELCRIRAEICEARN